MKFAFPFSWYKTELGCLVHLPFRGSWFAFSKAPIMLYNPLWFWNGTRLNSVCKPYRQISFSPEHLCRWRLKSSKSHLLCSGFLICTALLCDNPRVVDPQPLKPGHWGVQCCLSNFRKFPRSHRGQVIPGVPDRSLVWVKENFRLSLCRDWMPQLVCLWTSFLPLVKYRF